MKKSKNTRKNRLVYSIVHRTMAFVRIAQKQSYTNLVKTLRRVTYLGEKKYIHRTQNIISPLALRRRPTRGTGKRQTNWSNSIMVHLRPLVTVRSSIGLVVAIALVSWAPKPFVQAGPATETITMRPTVCRGWNNPVGAKTGVDLPTGDNDVPAARISLSDVAVTSGTGNLNSINQDLTCNDFGPAVDQSVVTLKSVRLVWNQGILGTANSLDVVRVEVRRNGQKTAPVIITPLNERRSGQQVGEMTGSWTFQDLQNATVFATIDLESADPFTVALNNFHFEVVTERIETVKVDEKKMSKPSKELDALVKFSQDAYSSTQQPIITVPKRESRRIFFFQKKKVDWNLQKVTLVDQNNSSSKPKYTSHDVTSGEEIDTTINLQTGTLRPGKYILRIEMLNSEGNTAIVEKTLYWGVIALNFDRSSPQVHEEEKVSMGVLDDKGKTICNADVVVKVRDPRGRTATYETRKKTIATNPNCVDKNVTNEADYHFNFTPHLVGTYHVSMRAKTQAGVRQYEDNLLVKESEIFDVQRFDYPTRINPYAGYKIRIGVTPRRDYTGLVYERAPDTFKISQLPKNAKVEKDPTRPGTQRIAWEVEWKKDSTYYLTYRFVAPPVSPALFLMGPISIGGDDLLGADFTEPRQWQIASDSISSISWDGSASSSWSNPANWSTNTIPQAGDTLVFPAGAANYSNTNDLGQNMWFNSIIFYDSGYTLAGDRIILGQGRNTAAIILPGIADEVSSGGNTISLDLQFDATQLISVTNSGEALTVSGAISGVGGLSKEGLGDLIFSGANSYAGVTKVNVGVLSARHNRALGTIFSGTEVVGNAALELQGTIEIDREALTLRGYGESNGGALRNVTNNNIFNGPITIAGTTEIASDSGTLTLNGGLSGTFNLNLDGAGNITFAKASLGAAAATTVTKNGAGTVTYNFPNTYTGLTTINAGTLAYGCDNAMMTGGITVNGGTLDIGTYSDMQGTITLGTLAGGSGTISGSTGMLSSSTWTVYAGTISAKIGGDAGTLSKSTPGTVTLSGANEFTGATTVTAGILKLQNSNALGTVDGITTLTSGASIQIDGNGLSIPEFITIAGVGLLNQGAIFNTTGDNEVTGLVTLSAAASIESATGTTLTFSDKGFTGAFGVTFDATGDIAVSAPIQTTSGAVIKDGPGNVTLTNYNSYTGTTTINFGTLTLSGNGSITTSSGVTTNSGSKLVMDNSSTVADRIGDAVGVTMNGGDIEYYGNSSTDSLGIAGALTLSGGQNTITVFAGTGGSSILRFASLTRTAGATGLFRGASLGATPAANVATIQFTTAPTLLGDDDAAGTPKVSILQGIFGDNSTSGSGTDMVTYGRGNNNGIRLLNGAGFSNEYTSDYLVTNANVKLTTATAAVTTQINSLILDTGASITNPGSAQTITFTSGNILNLQSSGSIAGANTTLAAGSTEFIIRTPQDLTVSSLITTTGGLSKAGTGTLTFSTAKTYTGLTSINSGTFLYGINDAISTGNVTVHDATLNMATYTDTVGAVVVQGGTITGTSGVLTATSYDFRASTISAIIGGSGTTTISNTNERVDAVTTLSRENTYTGSTAVSSGVLKLGATGTAPNTPLGTTGAGTTVSNGAMLDLNGFSLATTEALNFRGTGIAGQGAIINSSASPATYQGALTISTSGRIGADYGKITISGSISGAGLPLTVGGFGDIDITGVIGTTTGTVTKDGFGTYTPSNNNTYSGITTISVGRLKLGGTGSGTDTPLGVIGGATSITNAAGASLDLNGYTLVTAEPLTVNGIGAGTGDFASGAVLNSGSAVTYSGPVTLGASSMICGSSGSINFSNATMAGTGFTLTLCGSGGGTIGSAFTGGTNGAIVKIDSGTWTLSGSNTYTGATTIYQGTIQLGATGGATNTPLGTTGAGTTVYSGGVLDLNGFTLGTLEAFTLNGFGIANGGCVVNSSGNPNFSGNRTLSSDIRVTNTSGSALIWSGTSTGTFETRVGGSGDHTLQGVWGAAASTVWKDGAGIATVTAAQGWTGNTTIIAGTFRDGVLNGLSSGNVVVAGGTFDLSSNNGDTVGGVYLIDGTIATSGGGSAILTTTGNTIESGTISGVMAGAVTTTKNTAGTVSITGGVTASGALTINAGSVTVSGASGAIGSITAATINLGGALAVDNTSVNLGTRLSDSLVVTMNGGNFSYTGSSSAAASETISQLAYATGHNVVTVVPGAGGSTTLTVGNATCFNRSAGATVLYRGVSLGSTPAANVSTLVCTNAPTVFGGGGASGSTTISILRGSFGDNSTTGTGTDMVTHNVGNTNGLRLLNGPGFSGEYVTNGFGTNNANVKITSNTAAATQNVNSIVINGGDITNPGSTQTITTSGAALAGNILIASANNFAGGNTVVALTAATELSTLATAATTISALIGNSTTGIGVFSGSGNITLSAAQTYTGTTYINNGATVTGGAANVFSTGGMTIVGGTYNPNGNAESIGAITMTAGTITTGAATLTTTGTLTTIANANASSKITGTVALPTAAVMNIGDGLVDHDAVISAVLTSASTSLTKSTGTGVLVLSGDSTYTGTTAISTGTIRLGAAGGSTNTPLGTSAGNTTIASGSAFDFNGYSLTSTEVLATNGTGISNTGALLNTSSTAVTYPGLLNLVGATAIYANYGDINITNTGTVGNATVNLELRGNGNGSFASILGTTTGTLTKSGTGTWTVSGASTYTGVTTISVGVLKLGSGGSGSNTPLGTTSTGTTIASGAMLDLNGYTLTTAENLTNVAGTGIANAGFLVTNSASATSYSGTIALTAAARISNFGTGTFTLSGANSGNFALTLVTAPGDIDLSGVRSGTSTITKEGSGTLILSGQNSFSGAITVSTGILRVGANGGGTNTPLGTIAGGVTVSLGAVLDLSTFTVGGASTWEPLGLSGTGLKNGGAVTSSASGNNNFGVVTVTANSRMVNSGSGTVTLVGNVSIANTINLGIGGTGPTTISGAFPVTTATSATLAKRDSGLLIMSNAGNVYTGLTRIYGGTLRYGAANAVNTGGVTLAGGTLDFNGQTDSVGAIILYSGTITDSNVTPGVLTGSSYTFYGGAISGVLAGTGVAMPKSSGSTLTVNKSLTNTGTLTVNAGTVQYLASNVLSNSSALAVAGGTVDIGTNSDTVAAVTLTSGSIIGSTGVLTGASYSVATGKISAILAGAVNLTKTSTGTVVLAGTNTYTGITTIQGGALSVETIGNGTVPGNLGAATNAAANIVFSTATGTLIYTGGTASTDRNITTTTAITMQIDVNDPAATLTMSGATTNTTAPFTKVGGGTLVLSGTNLHTGVTTVLSGTLKYGAANILSTGALTVTNGILDMNGQSDSVGTVTLTNGGQIIDSAGSSSVLTSTATLSLQGGFISVKLGGSVTTAFTKSTTDRVVLSGDNTFTSTAGTVSVGHLRIRHNNALGASGTTMATTVSPGAVLEIQNSITTPSTKTLTILGTGINASGALQNVSDNNTVQGAITLGATNVRINSDSGQLTCSGAMTGTGFAVTYGGAGNIVYSGAVNTSTAGTVTKDGTGTATLSNANNYTGVTTISAGVLAISNATSTGTTAGGVTVASGAALEISGTTTVGAEALSLNGTGISSGGALRSTSGTTAWQGAVTLASNSSIGVDANTLSISGTITGSGSIGLTKVGVATLSVATTTLGGSMTISAGTLSAAGNISVGADWSNSGTFTANSSTVSLTSSTSAAITGTTTFNHLSVTGIGAAKTISFEHGSTTTISGTWTVTGAAGQLITLTRDSTSNWSVNPSAVSIDYVDVSYSTNLGSTICATHSVSTNGGNSGWNVTAGAACAATISISGTVYQSGAEGSVFDCTTNIVLYVSVNGGSNTAGSCTAVGGTFTISGVPDPAAANIPIVIFSDSSAAQKTTTVTLSSAAATNITGISLFIGRVTVTSESATNMTNTFMQTADNADAGIRYSVVTSGTDNLTVESGMELHVLAGKTFVPGGTVTTTSASTSGNPDGDVHIPGTATLSMGTNALSVGGDFTNAGTFTKSSGQTTTFTATGTGFTITPNGNNFDNLTFNGVSGGWTMSAVTAVDGNLTITNGTLTAPSSANLTISGNYSNSGTFTHNSGTVIFNAGASGKTIAGTMTGGSSFNNVQFNNASGGWTTNNSLTATGTFVVTAGAVTHGANTTLTVNGTNFTLSSGITWTKTSGTGKIVLDHATNLAFADNTSPKQNLGAVDIGASPGVITLTTDLSADTVTVPTGDTFNTKGYDVTTTGAFACNGTCTLNLTDTAPSNEGDGTILDVGGDMTINSGATFTAATGKVFMNSTAGTNTNRTFITGGKTYNDVELKNAGATNDDITISGTPFDINGTLTLTDGQIRLDTNDPNVTTAGNVAIASAATITKADNGTSTWTFDGSGTSTWTDSSGSGGQDLGLVNINGSTKTINLGSSVKAEKVIIAASQTLGLGSSGYTLTITGSGFIPDQPLQNSGTLNEGSSSTVKFTGTADSDIDPETFNNLEVSASAAGSPVFTVDSGETGNPLGVTGNLVVGDGVNTTTMAFGAFCEPTIGNNVTINASATFSGPSDYAVIIGGSYLNNGSYVEGGSGVDFSATTTGKTLAGNMTGANKFGGIVFSGSGGEWTNTSALEVNVITVSAGTFTGSNNVTVNGGVSGAAGVINRTGGTFTQNPGSGSSFGPSTASTAWTFNNLTFSTSSGSQITNTTSSCSTCTYTINGTMAVDAKVTLVMQSSSWSVTGSLTTSTTGAITSTGTPTVTVQGAAIGGGTGKIMFYNLTKSNAGTTTWTGTGENAVKNTLAISAGTLVAPSGRLVVGTVNQTGGTFTNSSGTILANSTSNQTFTLTSNAHSVVVNDGLVGYWNFDETAGTNAADASGYGYDGTHTGTPTIDTDVPSVNFTNPRSLSFNGTSQYVDMGTPEWLMNQWSDKLSISAWIKPTALSGDHVIVGQSETNTHAPNYYAWNIFQSGSIVCFRLNSTNACSAGSTLTTGWQNIIAVYDGANMYLYRNGTQVATSAKTGNVVAGTQNIRVGARHTSAMGEYFSGKIDDVRVYRRNLGSGEVTALSGGNLGTLSASTYTLGAALTVAGNLSLVSGTLDVASGLDYAVNVAGNWTNIGGAFTPRSGTVTFNGTASGKTITSRQQSFNLMAVSGASGVWTVVDDTTVSSNLTLTNGTLVGPAGFLTVGGDFNNAATFTHNSGTVIMNGSSKNITGGTATPFNNLQISGTTGIDAAGSDISVASLLTVDNTKTLTINTGRTVTLSGTSGTTLSLVGTITGAGRLTYKNNATAFPATGTISSILRMDATAGDQTIGGTNSATRTFGGLVEVYSNSAGTAKTVTLENGTARTFAFSGALNIIADNTQNLTLTADTATDPTVTVAGDIDFTGTGGGTEVLVAGTGTWTASGNVDFTSGTYTATSGNKLVMNGTSKTLTPASQSLYDYEVSGGTVAISGATSISRDIILSGGTLTGPSGLTVSVGRNWTKTSGSYTANTGTVALTTSTSATISGSNTFHNLSVTGIGAAKTVLTVAATTQTVTGTWTVTGASGQLVTIDASSAAQWNVNPSTASLDYVDISYTNNQGTAICATHAQSTNGNNAAITVTAGASCGITISGVIRQSSNETSAYDCSANTLTIGAVVNGGTSATADCTLNTGAYSINAANAPSAAGDPIVVYINNGETPIGTTVTLSVDTSSNITNLDIIDGRLVTTYENAGPMTNAKMATGDNGNAGIRYAVSSGNLTVESGIELHVKSGKTFTPGGTVTTTATGTAAGPAGDLHIAGTLTMGTNALTVGGDYNNAGTFNKTNTQTTTLAATGTGFTITPGTGDMNNLTISGDAGGNGTYTLSGANLTVDGVLTVNTGDTLSIDTSRTLTNSGSTEASIGGTVSGAGTLRFVNGSGGPGTGGTLSAITRFDASSGDIASTTVDARTYGAKVELYASSSSDRTITLPSGTFTLSGSSSHLHMKADGAGDLTVDGSVNSPTVTVGGDITLNGTGDGVEAWVAGDGTWTSSGNVDIAQGFYAPRMAVLNPTWDNYGYEQDDYADDGFGGCDFLGTSSNAGTSSATSLTQGYTTGASTSCSPSGTDFRYRSYLKFNLSGISNTSTVTRADLQIHASAAGGAFVVYRSNNDAPDGVADSSLYAVGLGTGLNSVYSYATGVNMVPMALVGMANIQSSLGNAAYAVVLDGGSSLSTLTSTDSATNKPKLRVGYVTTATTPTLVMNGTGTLSSGTQSGYYNLTMSGTNTFNATHEANIYNTLTLSGSITTNTAPVVMAGAASTLIGGNNTLGNLTVTNGTTTLTTSDLTTSLNVQLLSSGILSIASGRTFTAQGNVLLNSGTTISGAGTLTMTSTSSGPGTDGTLSSLVRYDATGGNIASTTMDARTYGGAVELYSNSGSARTVTAPSGTFVFSGALTTTEAGAGSLSVDFNTNDPTTTISGAITIGANTTLSANSANALNINGNYTNNGTFTNNSGTVTLAGASQQTLAGTMTSGSAFHHLTITNNSGSDPDSSPSVIFSTSSTMNGTLTAVTANTKLRFAAGITVTPAAINLNGQATNSRVTIHSGTPGALFTFTAGAGARTVSNTSVKDSSACSSTGGTIDASDGTNRDEGNAPCWAINTLTVSLSGNTIALGTLSTGSVTQGNIVSTITTNAPSGYISLVKYDQTLTAGGVTIPNAGGSITNGTAGYGASTSKSSQTIAQTTSSCSSGAGTFNASSLSTAFQSFASSASTASADATTLCLLATTGATTAPGSFQSTLTIVTTPRF